MVIARGDWTGENPDESTEVWLIDLQTPATIRPGKDAPTRVRWDAEPNPRRYDVIRGDVANLAAAGGTVELGPVVCLEDDSPDTDTTGFEDDLQPSPGQVFFFLYRGSQGTLDGPGSWGQGADGERVAGMGGCPS